MCRFASLVLLWPHHVYEGNCKTAPCRRCQSRLSCGFTWQGWRFVTVSCACKLSKIVLRDTHNTFAYHTLHTLLITLYTPHSPLDASTLRSKLYTPLSTLYIPHFTLHTLHSTLLDTLHWYGNRGKMSKTVQMPCFLKVFYTLSTRLHSGLWAVSCFFSVSSFLPVSQGKGCRGMKFFATYLQAAAKKSCS